VQLAGCRQLPGGSRRYGLPLGDVDSPGRDAHVAGRAKTRPEACGAIARNIQENRARQTVGAGGGGMSATIVLQLVQVATTVSGWSRVAPGSGSGLLLARCLGEALIVPAGQLCRVPLHGRQKWLMVEQDGAESLIPCSSAPRRCRSRSRRRRARAPGRPAPGAGARAVRSGPG
jgi:hypothetical protein